MVSAEVILLVSTMTLWWCAVK